MIIMTEQPEREARAVLTGIGKNPQLSVFLRWVSDPITMTFGLTSGVIGPISKAWVKLADQRMYQGKRQGKDQIVS